VLPLTDDPSVLTMYLSDLTTDLMPVDGKNAAAALRLADTLLERDSVPGSVLFVTDGIDRAQLPAFAEHQRRSRDQILVWAVGTARGGPVRVGEDRFATDARGARVIAKLDKEGLEALAQEGVSITGVSVEDDDVRRVRRQLRSHLEAVQADDTAARWRDFGYYLLVPVALLGFFWFRRGWTVRWVPVLLLFLTAGCSGDGRDFRFADLWWTPDQQGRQQFERGDFKAAADRFQDPMWKGIAFYSEGDYEAAITQFALQETAEAYFNLGNAYVRAGSYELAIDSYEQALERRPDWTEAIENRALAESLLASDSAPEDESAPPGGEPTFDPDEIVFDDKGEKGTKGEVPETAFSEEQLAETWMRRIQTTPVDFLRFKFALQAAQRDEAKEAAP
jgi:Ca-activated chloride channel family protein